MKNFLLNRFVLVIAAFIVGATTVWGTTKYFAEHRMQGLPSTSFILDELFNENIRFQGSFDNWFKTHFGNDLMFNQERVFNVGRIQEIKQFEDDDFKIFEIDLKDQTPKEVKVDVKNQFVTISAQVEKKENTGHTSRFYSSSFHRSFPVPPDVDGENFKMEQDNQKIVIKFPKKKV